MLALLMLCDCSERQRFMIRTPSKPARLPFVLVSTIGCGFMVILMHHLLRPGFTSRWTNLKDGMTQDEVRQALGTPDWTGAGYCIGAGGKPVTRWEYRSNQLVRFVDYYVDFDYIGPAGAPAVFRTEREESEPDGILKWTVQALFSPFVPRN